VVVSEELFLSCYGCGGRRKYWRLLLLLRHPPQKRQFDHLNWTTTQTCSSSSRRAPPVTQAFAEEAFSPSAPPLHEDDCVIGLNPRFPAASCSISYVVFCASCPSGYYFFFLFRSLTPWELPGVTFQLSFCFVLWDFPTFISFVHIHHQGLKFGWCWRQCNSWSWRLDDDDDDLTLGKKVSGPASPCVSSSCRLLFHFSHYFRLLLNSSPPFWKSNFAPHN
jgi:hypothetical protein